MERKGDILYGIVDSFTGEWTTYKKVLTWLDGTTMNSTLCDKIIYVETTDYPGEFFRREYSGPADVRWFGAKGDGVVDDTAAVQRAINTFTTDYWTGQRGGGQSILFPPGTYLLNDIQIGQGITLISYQLARDNFDSFVPAVLKPLTGVAQYVLHNEDDSRNCELIGLHIDGDFTNNPQLIAAVRWAGGFQKMINCNINKCAQYAVKSKAGAFVMQDCSIGGWFGAAPTDWTGDDDFRGAVHIEAAGDFYMLNSEISAALPYFTETGMAVLRDPIHRRICALAAVGFMGNSVVMGNLFENGDRAVVLSNGQYAYWANNRYEFSGGTGLTVVGGNRFMTFNGERFSGNSIAGDGLFPDIELRPGTFGSVTFTATTFMRSFATVEVPAFANRVNYNIDNRASADINFLGTVYDDTYYTLARINLSDLASLPVRQDLLQYDVDNVQFTSVSTKKPVADLDQAGYVMLTRGTNLAGGNLTGGVQFYNYLGTPKSIIGFNTGNDLWFNLNSVGGQYIFIGGGMFIPKAGGNNITLVSTDLVGTVAFNMSSGPGPDHGFSIVMDSATGNTRFTSGSPMTFGSGGTGNFTILSTGLTLIPTQPTPGDTATSFLLGRNASTGEMTVIDPDLFTPAAVVEIANTVWAGPGAGAPNYPTFRALVQQDIPSLPATKLPQASASTDGYLSAADFITFSGGSTPSLTATQLAFGSVTNTIMSSTKLTWTDSTTVLLIGDLANGASIEAVSSATGASAGNLGLFAGDNSSTGLSGTVVIAGGDSVTGAAGGVTISGGNTTGSSSVAGSVLVSSGQGGGAGSTGGNLTLRASEGVTTSGSIQLQTAPPSGANTTRLQINGSGEWLINGINGTTGQIITSNGAGTSPTWQANSAVPIARIISTTAPLLGGGDLSVNRTLSIGDAAADGTTKGAAAFTAADFNATAGLVSIDYTNGQAATTSLKGFLTNTDWNTFNGKIGTLNTLTAVTQTFATGTTGSDFGISSATSIHTFNLPSASASNRGALISADWTTFNNKLGTLNTLTATTQTFAVGTTGTDFNISSATSIHTFNIPDASAANRGLVTIAAQTFAGTKTFATLNATTLLATTALQSSSVTANIYVPLASSAQSITATTAYLFGGASTIFMRAGFSGNTSTVLTAGTNYGNLIIGKAAITEATSGTHTLIANLVVTAPVITNGTATTTNSASLYIDDAPTGATNNYSLLVNAGVSRFAGNTIFASNGTPAANSIPTGTDANGNWTWTSLLKATATLDFPSTIAATSADLTITVTGAVLGDPVTIGVPNGSVVTGTCYSAWVSAADTVTVRLNNFSAIPADPASGSFKVYVFKF